MAGHDDEPKRDSLGRWLPGTSGCPGGPKKGFRRLSDDLYRVLRETPTGDELSAAYDALEIPPAMQATIDMSGDRQEAFARLLAYRMLVGSWAAVDQIFGRLDPIPARTELSGPGGGPIVSAGLQLAGSAPRDAQATYLSLVRGEEEPDGEADTAANADGPNTDPGEAGP